jgi:hypothetical protein
MEGRSALLVSPTWAEIDALTAKVRSRLQDEGRLSRQEHEFVVFNSLSWTAAQRCDSNRYRDSLLVRFHRACGGFRRDETATLVKRDNQLIARRSNGIEGVFKLQQLTASFEVGEARRLKVATGDKLLLRANRDRDKFINGQLVEVAGIERDSIRLTDGRVIPPDYRTFAHGYALTSHASQGQTVDEVLVVATSQSLAAVNQQQFYVSISRGRDRCRVFTDDKELLRSRITRTQHRLGAIEAVGPGSSRTRSQALDLALRWARDLSRPLGELFHPAHVRHRVARRLSNIRNVRTITHERPNLTRRIRARTRLF